MVQSDQSNRTKNGSGCIWSYFNLDNAQILLLWLVIVIYSLFGAAVFSALERPSELEAHCKWNTQLAEFIQNHQIPAEELHQLLGNYEEAIAAGVRMEPRRPRWDFSGAFYFVATVVSTIGFGMAAPATLNGKIFLIFYGLIGCATTILFFNLFLERMITLITILTRWCCKQRRLNKKHIVSHLNTELGNKDSEENWKPSVYYVTLILAAAAFLVNCGASGLYSAMEDWSYLESMYFCFVAFSTMGFGDMVSGQRACYEARLVYQIANSLMIILGVSCTYSLFNVTSIIIRQMLNWILAKLFGLHCCSGEQDGEDEFCCCSIKGMMVTEPFNKQIQSVANHHSQTHGTCWAIEAFLKRERKTQGKADSMSEFERESSGEASFEIDDLDKDGVEKEAMSLIVNKGCTLSHHHNVHEVVVTTAVSNHQQETSINLQEH